MEQFEDKKVPDPHPYMSRESRPSIEEACTPTFFITRRSSNSDGHLENLQRELYGSYDSHNDHE
jgi:hypothetical protein